MVREKLGSRITMHGTMSIQWTMPFGCVEDVRHEVRLRIRTCGSGGGLILCGDFAAP